MSLIQFPQSNPVGSTFSFPPGRASSSISGTLAEDGKEPELTEKEKDALNRITRDLAWKGFKIGALNVGLKFGAVQGGVLALASVLAIGIPGAAALGLAAFGGSTLILGVLHAAETLDLSSGYREDVKNFFKGNSEEVSMNLLKLKHPDVAKALHIE